MGEEVRASGGRVRKRSRQLRMRYGRIGKRQEYQEAG
jgi:hypothetical protein